MIVVDLLRRGASHEVQSCPFYSHMPESLFGLSCTPQEVAAAQSTESELLYMAALRRVGLLPALETDDTGDEEPVFWDAQEAL